MVFGGVAGLEDVVSNDPDLRSKDAASLFDMYVNVCADQGSNTIRTEEAMLVALSALRPRLARLAKRAAGKCGGGVHFPVRSDFSVLL